MTYIIKVHADDAESNLPVGGYGDRSDVYEFETDDRTAEYHMRKFDFEGTKYLSQKDGGPVRRHNGCTLKW